MLSKQQTKLLFQFDQVKSSQSIFLCVMACTLLLDLPVQMQHRQVPQLVRLWPIHPPGLVRMWEGSGGVNNLSRNGVNLQTFFFKFSMKGVFVTCLCSRWRPLRSLSMLCPIRTSPAEIRLRRLFCTSFKVVVTLCNFSGVMLLYIVL